MAGFVVENRRGLIVGADLTQKVFPHPANALTLRARAGRRLG